MTFIPTYVTNNNIHSFLSYLSRLTSIISLIAVTFYTPVAARNLGPSAHMDSRGFASNSALSSGKWVKVNVKRTGLQFISASTLRSFGFSDPSKVNVYGYGGRIIPETLSADDPDDLPLLPVRRSEDGIRFFAYDFIRWNYSGHSNSLTFTHQMQPYAEESWYFLSDRELDDDGSVPVAEAGDIIDLPVITTFSQMLLHEKDLMCPAFTGRNYFGEDFRSPSTRSFSFSLPDLAPGEASARISFACKTSGPASISVAANGSRLPANSNDSFAASTTGDHYFYLNSTIKKIPSPRKDLSIEISFQNSGTVSLANLDFIEIEYPRHLKLLDGELWFNTVADSPSAVCLSGVNPNTVLLDITDPIRPLEIKMNINGSTGWFHVERGPRQFFAFNPDAKGTAISEGIDVPNQNLHAIQSPEMLIITPEEYKNAAERLALHHRDFDGMSVAVLTPESIYNEFSSGTPDPSAFRKLMKMWYTLDPGKLRYTVIMSRPTYDHKRLSASTRMTQYPRIPIWQSPTGFSKTTSYCTDDFIGMLEDCPVNFNIASAKINVAVGRMPATSVSEAEELVDKYINYALNPERGIWRNRILLIADDQDNGIHLNQSQSEYEILSSSDTGSKFLIDRLYLDTYTLESGATGNVYPEAKKKMLRLWNDEGVAMISYIGHASAYGWSHEDLLNRKNIEDFNNSRLPFLYAATCEFARYDDDERSGAELLWANPQGGIIATICPNRTVYMSPNGTLTNTIAQAFFNTGENVNPGRRIGDIFLEGKNNIKGVDDNKLRFSLIGNPAMRFPVPEFTVALEKINGVAVSDSPSDFPVLTAQSKAHLEGTVLAGDGSVAEDFSGTLDILLYDAEKVIDTLGNGENGVVVSYNDRPTLLYRGSVSVADGHWSANIHVPAEIENNFSPARLVFYARSPLPAKEENGVSANMREAHGASSSLYVYGYDEAAVEDNEGPSIILFTINNEGFTNGDVVAGSPVAIAKVSDPSGINLSDAGIGHKITLVLDGNIYFEDVNSFYTPEIDDSSAGSLVYPIKDIEAGKHSLKLLVWDNAGNSSLAELEFEIAANLAPQIYDLRTDVNPAREKVNFIVTSDRPLTRINALIEVFDLNGRKVWDNSVNASTDLMASITVPWNLNDYAGGRVSRGIYLYRATLTTESGSHVSKSGKLAVTAP